MPALIFEADGYPLMLPPLLSLLPPPGADVLKEWPIIVLSEDFLRKRLKFWEKNADNDVKGNESELHFGRATFPTRRFLPPLTFPISFRRNPPELGAEKQRPRPPTTQVRSPEEAAMPTEAARVRLVKSF